MGDLRTRVTNGCSCFVFSHVVLGSAKGVATFGSWRTLIQPSLSSACSGPGPSRLLRSSEAARGFTRTTYDQKIGEASS